MYYSHSGLTGPPFQLTSSPAQLYMSTEHREAYAALEWGLLHEPSGAILRAHSEFLVRTAIARLNGFERSTSQLLFFGTKASALFV